MPDTNILILILFATVTVLSLLFAAIIQWKNRETLPEQKPSKHTYSLDELEFTLEKMINKALKDHLKEVDTPEYQNHNDEELSIQLQTYSPETIAVFLTCIPLERAIQLLLGFPYETHLETIKAIKNLENLGPNDKRRLYEHATAILELPSETKFNSFKQIIKALPKRNRIIILKMLSKEE